MEGIADRGWSLDAAEAGLAAGLLFAAFEMIVGAVMTGTEGFFRPVRMIGAIVLGPRALSPAYSLSTALIVGIVVHLILSVCFALLFIVIAQPWTMRSVQTLLVLASIYGPLLWLANFYVVAPAAGWYWLPHQSSAAIQLCAHMLYGWRLGMFLRRPALVGVNPALTASTLSGGCDAPLTATRTGTRRARTQEPNRQVGTDNRGSHSQCRASGKLPGLHQGRAVRARPWPPGARLWSGARAEERPAGNPAEGGNRHG